MPAPCVNAPVCATESSKREWIIARDLLTDLVCVVDRNVLPQHVSQVGRAMLRLLRRWPDEFGGHWLGSSKLGRCLRCGRLSC